MIMRSVRILADGSFCLKRLSKSAVLWRFESLSIYPSMNFKTDGYFIAFLKMFCLPHTRFDRDNVAVIFGP